VQGGQAFRLISAGGGHTCAVSTADVAYCWGGNRTGELGNGSGDASGAPVAVAGNFLFEAVSASGFYDSYTCGLTKGELAYCWGAAPIGESAVPAMVPGQR
jgi:alpha-tubulin suppressor-like RCC1 family protein